MSDANGQDGRDRPGKRPSPADQSGIIVFGGGGSRGCAGKGCLFWIVLSIILSVTLTVLANLVLLLF